ncbi:AMP-binding protein [Bacillus sp. FJAT-49736]|uniref:class I adenylate-forming enzyme family protein n=1 Tax=Bacillus sp. FJAT-49736 TaxID=2833582 RepID=UPI0020167656|nr:AMP-binding protein [Bacillus sp. FJAT-49736]
MITIHRVLERNARKHSKKEAFISKTARLTYPDMNSAANRLARYLQEKGVKRKDHVAVLSRNNEHFFYAYFALMKLGAIPIPLNGRLTANEMIPILENMDTVGVLFESVFSTVIHEVNNQLNIPHPFSIEKAVEQSLSYSTDNLHLPIDHRDICQIVLTSGTTGVPKGVQFTHEQIIAAATGIAIEFHISSKDRALTLMPLSHSAPLNLFFMAPFYCGATHIIGDYAPQDFLKWIQEEKTTLTFAAPIAYLLAAKDQGLATSDLSSMRLFAYGGGAMPLASFQFVSQAFNNKNFYQVYGLTEAGPNGCYLRPEEHQLKPGSIGKTSVVNVEMKVLTDEGTETAPGEYGEIVLKGDSLMAGYYKNDADTLDALKDGWLHSGDIAYRDEDGFFYIVDRKKDVIIPGGVNVYPREIEEVLTRHPDVSQACVVGVEHGEWGETIKAVIVLKEDSLVEERELRQFVADHLAEYKNPRLYSFVKELPYNASGKILKQKVKEM